VSPDVSASGGLTITVIPEKNAIERTLVMFTVERRSLSDITVLSFGPVAQTDFVEAAQGSWGQI
jgi:hypothetical protein